MILIFKFIMCLLFIVIFLDQYPMRHGFNIHFLIQSLVLHACTFKRQKLPSPAQFHLSVSTFCVDHCLEQKDAVQ
jgi:hypothetical protein